MTAQRYPSDDVLEEIARRVLSQGYKHRDLERRFAHAVIDEYVRSIEQSAQQQDDAVVWGVDRAPAQKRPQNCGTGYCSCIDCVMTPAQQPRSDYRDWDYQDLQDIKGDA